MATERMQAAPLLVEPVPPTVPRADPALSSPRPLRGVHVWEHHCGLAYRVWGYDRHRLYWPDGGSRRDAVIDGCCVRCRLTLPGKVPHCAEE